MGMRSFNMGRFGNGDDPWFRVGNVDVTTTIFVVGMGLLSVLVWAAEGTGGPILRSLIFTPSQVLDGQVWRLVTWPIANALTSIWVLLLFAVFFMLGSQLEAAMGRRLFTTYLVILTIVPTVVLTVLHLIGFTDGGAGGLRMVELGVLVGFALRHPDARFWPGIPAWIIGAGIVVINLLQFFGFRDWFSMLFLLVTVGVSLVTLRSMGFAEEAEWVPKVPLPAQTFGQSAPARSSGPSTSRRKKRGRGKLKAVPEAPAGLRRDLTKFEEAEMDAILDQVSEQGMNSLSPQQRSRLEEHAKRLRQREQ